MSSLSKMSMSRLLPIVIAVGLTMMSLLFDATPQGYIRTLPVVLAWVAVLVRFIPAFAKPIHFLWRNPALLWIIILIACVAIVLVWLIEFQPAVGIPLSGLELFWLIGGFYGVIAISTAITQPEKGNIGWLASPLITLTTIVLIIIGVELGLRYLWIMSDNFQFSAMHRNWSRLYWNPLNDVGEGYRDYPPASNDERTHILVAGDSLVAGYGMNSIEDTFPHLLVDRLGENYTMNIVAQPGWGISTAFGAIQNYPTQPDIVILSHYINDIAEGAAGQQYGQPFPTIRLEPNDNQRWWVENFYIANFLYYRVYLYTQHDSVGLYNDWLRGAYENEVVWNAYQAEMQAWINWAAANDVELIVIVWSNLLAIEEWRDVTQPVIDYFLERGIPVVDMSEHLAGESPNKITVNLFDAHPSEYSHNVAAEQLYEVITGSKE
jgi:hypothetical protein